MRQTSNPPWTDKILHRHCDSIRRAADKRDLPHPLLDAQCRIEDRSELGKGSYGVVWTTSSDDCAFKLTTDATEAYFIQTAINLRKKDVDPEGIIDYRAIFKLSTKHDNFDVFAIWREQAVTAGFPKETDDNILFEFGTLIEKFYQVSDKAFQLAYDELNASHEGIGRYYAWIKERVDLANDLIDGKDPAYDSEFARRLHLCYMLSMKIEDNPLGRPVGEALREYFEHGILLCDIHGGNVGTVERGKKSIYVITDPGHALVLDKKLMDVKIGELS